MNVLVITEDHTFDEQMLKPLLTKMLDAIGLPHATLRFYQNPKRQRGHSAVTQADFLARVIRQNPMSHLFLLVVDRDGSASRRQQLDAREAQIAEQFGATTLIAGQAHQEIEAWVLVGQANLPSNWSIKAIRAERDVKEAYFVPFAEQSGVAASPGGGRALLAKQADYKRIRRHCDEIFTLEERLRTHFEHL